MNVARRFRGILAVGLFLAIVSTAQAKYSGGSGTVQDPYQIATAADLIALGETSGDYDKHFILTADIDLDPNLPGRKVFDKAVIAPDADPNTEWSFEGTPFSGVFDGNAHTISNVTIQGGTYLGLFGRLDGGAVVKDLGVLDVNMTGSGDFVGGLGGSNATWERKGATVTHCHSTGVIWGKNCVGGLIGGNYGNLNQCYSDATANGDSAVGGLLGFNCGSVSQCYSNSSVKGHSAVGGLAGEQEDGYVGESYSTGRVRGDSCVGGLVAINYNGVVHDCHSSASVNGEEKVGGFVGSSGPEEAPRRSDAGVFGSFWDIQTSGQTTSFGGTGKTTAQMQTAKTFLDAGWDFVGETKNGPEDIWWILEGKDYPRLWWELTAKDAAKPNLN